MIRLVASFLAGVNAVSIYAAQAAWQPHPALPLGVAGHAAAAQADGTLWVAGGSSWQEGNKVVDRIVRRLRPGTTAWETVLTLPWGFAHGGFVATPDALWLIGGLGAHGPSRELRCVTFASAAVATKAQLPEPRIYCGAAVLDGGLWIIGGARADGAFAALPRVWWRYDCADGSIQSLPSPGPAIVNPVVLALRGELHVLPGSIWSDERQRLEPPAEVWIYSPAGGRWTTHRLARSLPRGLSGIALDESRALLAGGVELQDGNTRIVGQSWIYNAEDRSLQVAATLPEPRFAAALATDGVAVWLTGGEDRPRGRAATVWRLDRPLSAKR